MSIRNVLIVDDSKTELMYLSDMLKKAGFAVTTAENAEDAQRKLDQGKPDLILMDVVMPGQNGFQLTRAISRDPRFTDVPSSCAPARIRKPIASGACAKARAITSPSPSIRLS